MVTKKSCTKLKMSEFDDTFSDERATPEVRFSSVLWYCQVLDLRWAERTTGQSNGNRHA